FPTPAWNDIVDPCLNRTSPVRRRKYPGGRRMKAMLEHLIDNLLDARAAALKGKQSALEACIARSFVEAEDHRRANLGDFQELGGSSARTDEIERPARAPSVGA